MRISEQFLLNKTQFELDFVDIDPAEDLDLFLDPHYLSMRDDEWSLQARVRISAFFQILLEHLRGGNENLASRLFSNLSEPNETCLGLSKSKPRGRGAGPSDAMKIFGEIRNSKAIKTGLVEDLEDSHIFVRGVGPDKLSDMTTNLIRDLLIQYTQEQCRFWGIPLSSGIPSGPLWNADEGDWYQHHTDMLVVNHKPIVLVPKGIATIKSDYTPEKYHRYHVIPYLQDQHLRMKSALVRVKQLKNGRVEYLPPFKKTLEEKEAPLDKEYLSEFTEKHREVFIDFKKNAKVTPVSDEDLTSLTVEEVVTILTNKLRALPRGGDYATEYHRLIAGALELILFPRLSRPKLEEKLYQGRKRVDISFVNSAIRGFFRDLHLIHNQICRFVFGECKNYTDDVGNPEVDQIAGRLANHTSRVGFLIYRKVENKNLLTMRCSDAYKAGNGLILPLDDDDIIQSLSLRVSSVDKAHEIFYDRYRAIALG